MNDEKKIATERARVLMPSASSVYRFGWDTMKKSFLDLFLVAVIIGAILIPLAMISSLDGGETAGGVLLQIFSFAYWVLLLSPIEFGAAFLYLNAVRGRPIEVKDMFSVFENYLNVVLAGLLKGTIIGIGIAMLLVPGIIFACRLAFVRYLVMDRKMEPVAAVKESWRLTRGHAWDIFLIGLLAVPIAIAGLICFGVGIVPAIMWIRCAFASMYYAVTGKQEEAPSAPTPAQAGSTD